MPPKKETGAGEESTLPERPQELQNANVAQKVVKGIVGLVDKGVLHTALARSAIVFALDNILKVDEDAASKEAVSREEAQGSKLCRLILQGAYKNGIISEDETHAGDIVHFAQLALPEAFKPAYQKGQVDEITILVGVLGLAIEGVLMEGNVPERLAEYFEIADLMARKHDAGEDPQRNQTYLGGQQQEVPSELRKAAYIFSQEEAIMQSMMSTKWGNEETREVQLSQSGPPARQQSSRSSSTSSAFSRACIARLKQKVSGTSPGEDHLVKEIFSDNAAAVEQNSASPESHDHASDSPLPHSSTSELVESAQPTPPCADSPSSAVEQARFAPVMNKLKNWSPSRSSKINPFMLTPPSAQLRGGQCKHKRITLGTPSCTHQVASTDDEEALAGEYGGEETEVAAERIMFQKVLDELKRRRPFSLTCIHRTSCSPEVDLGAERDEAQYARMLEELDILSPSMPCIYRAASTGAIEELAVSSADGKTKVDEGSRHLQHPSETTQQTSTPAASVQIHIDKHVIRRAEYEKRRGLVAKLLRANVPRSQPQPEQLSQRIEERDEQMAISPLSSTESAHSDGEMKGRSHLDPFILAPPSAQLRGRRCAHERVGEEGSSPGRQTEAGDDQTPASRVSQSGQQVAVSSSSGQTPPVFNPILLTPPSAQVRGGRCEQNGVKDRRNLAAQVRGGRCEQKRVNDSTDPTSQQTGYTSTSTEKFKQISACMQGSGQTSTNNENLSLCSPADNSGESEFSAGENKVNIKTKPESGSQTSASTGQPLSSDTSPSCSNFDDRTSVYGKTSEKTQPRSTSSQLTSTYTDQTPEIDEALLYLSLPAREPLCTEKCDDTSPLSHSIRQSSTPQNGDLMPVQKMCSQDTAALSHHTNSAPLNSVLGGTSTLSWTRRLLRNCVESGLRIKGLMQTPTSETTPRFAPCSEENTLDKYQSSFMPKQQGERAISSPKGVEQTSASSSRSKRSRPALPQGEKKSFSLDGRKRPTRSPGNSTAEGSHGTHRSKSSRGKVVSVCSNETQTTLRARGKRTSSCSSGTQTPKLTRTHSQTPQHSQSGTQTPEVTRTNSQTPQHSQSELSPPHSHAKKGSSATLRSDSEQISLLLYTETTSMHLESGPTLLFSPSDQTSPTSCSAETTSTYSPSEQMAGHSGGKQSSPTHLQRNGQSPSSSTMQTPRGHPPQIGQPPVASQYKGSSPVNAMMLARPVLAQDEPGSLLSHSHNQGRLQSHEESHEKAPPYLDAGDQTLIHSQYSNYVSVCWHGKRISVCQQCSSQISVCSKGQQLQVQSQCSSQASVHTQAWLLQNDSIGETEEEKAPMAEHDSSDESKRSRTQTQAKRQESRNSNRQTAMKLQYGEETLGQSTQTGSRQSHSPPTSLSSQSQQASPKVCDQQRKHPLLNQTSLRSHGSQTSPILQCQQSSPKVFGQERTPPLLREQISVHLQESDEEAASSQTERMPTRSDCSYQLSLYLQGEQTSIRFPISDLVSMHSACAQTSMRSPAQLQRHDKSSIHSLSHQASKHSAQSDQTSRHLNHCMVTPPSVQLSGGQCESTWVPGNPASDNSAHSDQAIVNSKDETALPHSLYSGTASMLWKDGHVSTFSANSDHTSTYSKAERSSMYSPYASEHSEFLNEEQTPTSWPISDQTSLYSINEWQSMFSANSNKPSMLSKCDKTSIQSAHSDQNAVNIPGEHTFQRSQFNNKPPKLLNDSAGGFSLNCKRLDLSSDNVGSVPLTRESNDHISMHSVYSARASMISKGVQVSMRSPYSDLVSMYSRGEQTSIYSPNSNNTSKHSKREQTSVCSPNSEIPSMHCRDGKISMYSKGEQTPAGSPYSEKASIHSKGHRTSVHSRGDQASIRSPYSTLVSLHSKGQQTSMQTQSGNQSPNHLEKSKDLSIPFRSGKELSPAEMLQPRKDLSPRKMSCQSGDDSSPKLRPLPAPRNAASVQTDERTTKSAKGSLRSHRDEQTSPPPEAFTCRSDLSKRHVTAPDGDVSGWCAMTSTQEAFAWRSDSSERHANAPAGDPSRRSVSAHASGNTSKRHSVTPTMSNSSGMSEKESEKTPLLCESTSSRGLAGTRLIREFEAQAVEAINRKVSMQRLDNIGAGRFSPILN